MSIEQLDKPAGIKQLFQNRWITNFMYIIWKSRNDLQQAFDLNTREGQEGFCHWYEVSVLREYGITPQLFEFDDKTKKTKTKTIFFSSKQLPLCTRLMRSEGTVSRFTRGFPQPVRKIGKSIWHHLLAIVAQTVGENRNQPRSDGNLNHSVTLPVNTNGQTGANLIGYAKAELGMGEHVRMTAAALDTTDVKFSVVNFSGGVPSRQKASLDYGKLDTGNIYRANIFHINADQMLRAYCLLGRDFFSNRYNVGYWAWELAKCPEEWIPLMEMVDEIWAPSKFIQSAFSERTSKPVEYMPLCVSLPIFPKLKRKYFDLPEDTYLFLNTFDFFSYIDRKNPFAAIIAFKKAFPSISLRVGLVIKIMNGNEKNPKWTQMIELIDNDPRIYVFNRTFYRKEILALFDTCDSLLSLHRSEGFGRGPAEAMYLGKPVVVTNYSGNTDFTLPENSCLVNYQLIPVEKGTYVFEKGQVWAEVDIEHAAWHMQKLADNDTYAKEIGSRGKATIHSKFSPSVIGKIYKKHLQKIYRFK